MLFKMNGKPVHMAGGLLHVWGPTLGDIVYWTCNNCGYNQNAEGNATCAECGYNRYWTPSTWECVNCGTWNSEDSEYCSECGTWRYEGTEIPPSVEYDWECPNCHTVNHEYDNDQWNHYCDQCGFNEMNGFDEPPPEEPPPEEPPIDEPPMEEPIE